MMLAAAPTSTDAGLAPTLDWLAETGPALTVIVGFWLMTTPLAVAVMVFTPAPVDETEPVATPEALVGELGWTMVFPDPVANKVTVAPTTGFPPASRAVTVTAEELPPAVNTAGETATLDVEPETTPAETLKDADRTPGRPGEVALSVQPVPAVSMVSDANVATPATALMGPPPDRVAPPALAPNPIVTGAVELVCLLPNWSRISTWTAGVIGIPMVVPDGGTRKTIALAGAGLTTTVSVCSRPVPPTTAEITFGSAWVEENTPAAIPLASVRPDGWVRTFPVPVAARLTATLGMGLP